MFVDVGVSVWAVPVIPRAVVSPLLGVASGHLLHHLGDMYEIRFGFFSVGCLAV